MLMLALYGSGRQAEALEVYRETRRLLVDELGIEPSPALHELEQAILRHDPALTSQSRSRRRGSARSWSSRATRSRLDDLLAIAEPLARRPARELILARLLRDDSELAAASAALVRTPTALSPQRGVTSRVAAYTTAEPGTDAVRLATEHDVDLVLLDAATGRSSRVVSPTRISRLILERAPCDVGVLSGTGEMAHGTDRDAVRRRRARLVRDRGRGLARAVARDNAPPPRNRGRSRSRAARRQPAPGPRLTPGAAGCRNRHRARPRPRRAKQVSSKRPETPACSSSASPIAGGPRASAARDWPSRLGADVPTLFVRRGLRPSGVAPNETLTRFTWTLGSEQILPASP